MLQTSLEWYYSSSIVQWTLYSLGTERDIAFCYVMSIHTVTIACIELLEEFLQEDVLIRKDLSLRKAKRPWRTVQDVVNAT
jgi:hypothetical protein